MNIERMIFMDQKISKLFLKADINPNDILYIIRNGRKTEIHLNQRPPISTYLPVKEILHALPKGAFLNITKGVVVSADKIAEIKGDTYKMCNGKEFRGRRRGMGEHKANRKHLEKSEDYSTYRVAKETVTDSFSGFDKSVLPTCVVEIEKDTEKSTANYTLRYFNTAMAMYENLEKSDIINNPQYKISFANNEKWLMIFHDVAINNTVKTIKEYDTIHNLNITVYCHQPAYGHCALTIVPTDNDR